MTDNQTIATFKYLPQLDEMESTKQGREVYKEADLEVCEIRFGGNKQTVGVYPAHELCEWRDNQSTGIRERITYALKFNDQYLAFKRGEAQVAFGTPLEALGDSLKQGKRLELKALNIHTVEALASIDGVNLKTLGMGGRDLKTIAQSYLDTVNTSDVSALAAENARMRRELAELRQASSTTAPKRSKKAKDEPVAASEPAAPEVVDDTSNPFSGWEADDIKNWIQDTRSGFEIDDNWNLATLAEKAKEINDELAGKKG